MNAGLARLLLLLAAGALLLRLPQLDRRPLHNDEGVNAVKIQALWEKGFYRYDPDEYHGPTLYYATLPFLWLSPARSSAEISDSALRLAPVFFGAGLIPLLWLLRGGLGRAATLAAAVLFALSPAMVFYSRYFIHEMLLVFFGLLAIAGGWRYTQKPSTGWALLTGAAVGLMHATKETFVFAVAAMGLASAAVWVWRRRAGAAPQFPAGFKAWHFAAAAAASLAVAALFFTSFFTNARGPLDAVLTYEPWFTRAGGQSPHNHPWYFYLERLFWFHPRKSPPWSEGIVLLLALVGCGASFFRRQWPGVHLGLARFLAVFSLLLTLIYSAIPYKTPWCLLEFYSGLILMAGLGTALLVEVCRPLWSRLLLFALLLLAAAHLGWQTWKSSFVFAADRRNPYVYAQTSADLHNLLKRVTAVSRFHPEGDRMVIKVISPESYWPLPWYLRQFQRVGWWEAMPEDPFAPVTLVNSKLNALLDEKSNKQYLMAGLFELRPGTFFELYVELELWKRYVASLPKAPME